ncbi:hypothetical protein PSP6_300066 [Paraburkholderia tropica]|nr:hypothetical protein PSP6_300066 [Paraburkholderia tropica]
MALMSATRAAVLRSCWVRLTRGAVFGMTLFMVRGGTVSRRALKDRCIADIQKALQRDTVRLVCY